MKQRVVQDPGERAGSDGDSVDLSSAPSADSSTLPSKHRRRGFKIASVFKSLTDNGTYVPKRSCCGGRR